MSAFKIGVTSVAQCYSMSANNKGPLCCFFCWGIIVAQKSHRSQVVLREISGLLNRLLSMTGLHPGKMEVVALLWASFGNGQTDKFVLAETTRRRMFDSSGAKQGLPVPVAGAEGILTSV